MQVGLPGPWVLREPPGEAVRGQGCCWTTLNLRNPTPGLPFFMLLTRRGLFTASHCCTALAAPCTGVEWTARSPSKLRACWFRESITSSLHPDLFLSFWNLSLCGSRLVMWCPPEPELQATWLRLQTQAGTQAKGHRSGGRPPRGSGCWNGCLIPALTS